jgi:hypothetical protein
LNTLERNALKKKEEHGGGLISEDFEENNKSESEKKRVAVFQKGKRVTGYFVESKSMVFSNENQLFPMKPPPSSRETMKEPGMSQSIK